jgi:hypothetical protein
MIIRADLNSGPGHRQVANFRHRFAVLGYGIG